MRTVFVAFVLASTFLAVLQSSTSEAVEPDVEGILRSFMDRRAPVSYEALYALPETKAAFISVAGKRALETSDPSYLAAQFSSQQKKNLMVMIAGTLKGERDRSNFFKRMSAWLIAYDQIGLCMSLTSKEPTLAALFALPVTRSAFDSVIESRGFDAKTVAPERAGETLASFETIGLTYCVLNTLSTLERREQVRYFRDLYGELLQQLEKQSNR